MTISVKHNFTSAKSDGTDSTLIQPSNWNAEHTITLAAGKVLGRDSSGNGAMQELPLSFDTSGNMAMSATGSFIPAVGTTAQRPGSPTQGMVRFNTTSSKVELYNGTIWGSVGGGATISDTAPSSPSAGDLWWKSDEGQMYVYYTDANSSQWVVANAYAGGAAYLPLAGGQVTGNVGIGVGTGSGYRVAIAGSAASAVPLYLHSDATNAYVYSSSPLVVGSTGNYSTFLVANNGIKFVVGTLGQFGIGAANAVGTSGQVLTSGGSSAPPTWQTITAPQVYSAAFGTSTTWTAPTGCTSVKVWCIGGGGGGGLNSSCAATPQSGGAGGVSIGVYTVTPGTVYTVTVGAGGAGAATNVTNGSSGGTSSFGPSGSPVISATGGAGGSNNSTTYSAQGVGSSGTIYNSTSLLVLPSNIAFAPHGSSPLGTSISCGYPAKFGASGDQVAKTWSSGVYSPGVGGGGSGGSFSGGGVNGIIWLDWVA